MNINQAYWWLAVLLAVVRLTFPSVAQATPVAWQQPEQQWLSQQSPHFTINFLAGQEATAAQILDISEQVHQQLLPFFKKAPTVRSELVLVDDYDFSNGWVTMQPFAQVRLFISPPEDVFGLEVNDQWLHTLILHEYVHILHLELADGAVAGLRHIFGRNLLLFPHVLTPSLLIEGLAVYLETDPQLGYGRLQGSNYAMQMRMQVASGELKDMQQVAVASREWPFNSPYLYGGYFIKYLINTYGEQKLQIFLDNYSKQLLPYFLLNRAAIKPFGKTFLQLWKDFQGYLTARYRQQLIALEEQKVVGRELDHNLFRQITTTSDAGLVVERHNGEDRRQIAVVTSNGEGLAQWQNLSATKGVTDLAMHPQGGLAVARILTNIDGSALNDLFLYRDQQWTRLTKRARFRKVRWLANGKQLIASRKVAGLSELWLLESRANGQQTRLWQGPADTVLGGFALAPAGDYLVAALKRPQQGWNLERLPLDQHAPDYLRWQPLTETKAVENSPEILADGRILYSADYHGVYNIFVLDPQTKQISQWTREVGGAFRPHWQPGMGLVYQAYDGKGYSLRVIAQPLEVATFSVNSQQGRYDYPPVATTKTLKSAVWAYTPWSTIRPRSWFPYISVDAQESRYGITTYGTDALARHNYQLAADWDTHNNLANYAFDYQYDNRWYGSATRSHSFKQATSSADYYIFKEDLLSLQRRNIWPLWEDDLNLHVGIFWDMSKLVELPETLSSSQYQVNEQTLAGVAVTFDNREAYLNVADIGWGHYLDLVLETNAPLDSDYSGEKLQGQWAATWDLPGRNTLSARFGFGYASTTAKSFKLGGNDLGDELLLFGRDTQALRGYEQTVQTGHRYLTQRMQLQGWLGRGERNWRLLPLGLGDISGSLFVDSGVNWDPGEQRNLLTGIGAELTVELNLGYSMRLPLTFGVAKGLDNSLGKEQGYLRIQVNF